jgi:anti-sigma factor RsiW
MFSSAPEHVSDEEFLWYLDGELADRRRSRLEDHLITCQACSQRLVAWRDLYGQLESLPDLTLERDFVKLVEAKIQARRRSKIHWAIWVAQGASLVLLLTFGSAWVWQGWRQVSARIPVQAISMWVEGLLASTTTLLWTAERLFVSITRPLIPSVPDGVWLPLTNTLTWALLIGGVLMGIFGNRLVLMGGTRSERDGR